MGASEDKHWASKYLLDPLSAPEPSDETGPGTHFGSTFAPAKEEKKQPRTTVAEVPAYPSPPDSASPHRTRFPDLVERQNTNTNDRPSTEIPTSSNRASTEISGRRRGSSLAERYEGDESHRPLDIIRRESKRAHRSPHLRKERHHGLDTIDKLDSVGDSFHHEGPYDAVSWARNSSSRGAPVAALAGSNAEALKATPQAFVHNSLKHHRPLDGVAQVPAGVPDRLTGQVLDYEEGTDMQRDDERNRLNHWQGVEYSPGDHKGKGEPSYTVEKNLKASKHGRHISEGGIELQEQSRRTSSIRASGRDRASSGAAAVAATGNEQSYAEWETGLRRSSSARAPKLIGKFGSLTRRHRPASKDMSA